MSLEGSLFKWRRGESNPHFRDATAVCSRYTTSPMAVKEYIKKLKASQRCGSCFVGVGGEDLAEIYAMIVSLGVVFAFRGVGEHLRENVGRA